MQSSYQPRFNFIKAKSYLHNNYQINYNVQTTHTSVTKIKDTPNRHTTTHNNPTETHNNLTKTHNNLT